MIRAILTDIEGTTSSLSFVKDVLFPYAREALPEFVRQHADEKAVAAELSAVSELMKQEDASGFDLEARIDWLLDAIAADRKVTPLKALQGMIWEAGYEQGDFKGHIYDDAVERLRAWAATGLDLHVYSSGSVHAQKLLFAHTEFGDLTALFKGYFDTRTGAKTDTESYLKIAAELGLEPADMLFLSDIEAELQAASDAGMQVIWLLRDAQPDPDARWQQVRDFNAIDPGL